MSPVPGHQVALAPIERKFETFDGVRAEREGVNGRTEERQPVLSARMLLNAPVMSPHAGGQLILPRLARLMSCEKASFGGLCGASKVGLEMHAPAHRFLTIRRA